MTDHVTLRLHTGGLDLTNYVTSEGNWLHKILFKGFIAKGMITYARTILPVVKVLGQSFFSSFHFTNLDYFVYVHYMKSK